MLARLKVAGQYLANAHAPKSRGVNTEAEMNHLVERQGYKIIKVSITYRACVGEKKLKLRRGLTVLKRIVAESLWSRFFV